MWLGKLFVSAVPNELHSILKLSVYSQLVYNLNGLHSEKGNRGIRQKLCL